MTRQRSGGRNCASGAAVSLGASAGSAAEQLWQCVAPRPLTASQTGQNLRSSDEPQASQNLSSTLFSCWQARHLSADMPFATPFQDAILVRRKGSGNG